MGVLAPPPGQRVQRFRTRLGVIPYSAGGTVGLPGGIPKSGYLTRLDLNSLQTVTVGATAPVLAGYGAYGPLGMITVTVGPDSPYALPGLYAKEFFKTYDSPYTDSLVAAPIPTSTTSSWVNNLHIPLTISPDTELGAWYTSDDELTMDLQLSGNAPSTVFSTVNAATLQGSWEVWAERFSAPAPDQPGGWLKQISYWHETKVIMRSIQLANGNTDITLPRNRDYLSIGLVFYTGSSFDATFAPARGLFNWISLVVNDETSIYNQMNEQTLLDEMLLAYREVPNNGFYWLDFMHQRENSTRDVLPTDSQFASAFKLTINSNSSNNRVDVITETVQANPFAQRWAAQAAANQNRSSTPGRSFIPQLSGQAG